VSGGGWLPQSSLPQQFSRLQARKLFPPAEKTFENYGLVFQGRIELKLTEGKISRKFRERHKFQIKNQHPCF